MQKSPIVIFDIDGTLVVESVRLLAQTRAVSAHFGQTFEEMQATLFAFFAVNDYVAKEKPEIKNNIPVYLELMGERLGCPVSGDEAVVLAEKWSQAYANAHIEPELFLDVVPCLQKLQDSGFCLMVASGNTVVTRMAMLEKTGIAHFFSHVYAATDVGFQKQDVRFWYTILGEMGYESGDTVIVVGNQLNDDIVNPIQLGLTAFLIDRPSELKKIAEEPAVEPTAIFPDLDSMLTHAIFRQI